MENILITGGAGYLGSVLSEHLLHAGFHVTVVDNLAYGQTSIFHLAHNSNFSFVNGDARDERLMSEQIKDADVIIPLAAVVGAPACARDPSLAESLNLDAVRLVARLSSPGQLILYPNTNSGYGTQSGESMCTEETPLEPISIYGRTKCQAEIDLLQRTDTITLRLATVFGMSSRMRIDLLVNYFVHEALTNGYIVIFEKDFKRNYIHIRDVADCFIHCIQQSDKMAGYAYNLGLDEANLSKEQLGIKIKEYIPDLYLHFSEIGTDPDKRNYLVSNERLRKAGFEAKRSLDDGILELI